MKIGDFVLKVNGYGAGLLMGIVIGFEDGLVVVFTDNEVDRWQEKFVEIIDEI